MKLLDQDFAFVRSETAFAVETDGVGVGRDPILPPRRFPSSMPPSSRPAPGQCPGGATRHGFPSPSAAARPTGLASGAAGCSSAGSPKSVPRPLPTRRGPGVREEVPAPSGAYSPGGAVPGSSSKRLSVAASATSAPASAGPILRTASPAGGAPMLSSTCPAGCCPGGPSGPARTPARSSEACPHGPRPHGAPGTSGRRRRPGLAPGTGRTRGSLRTSRAFMTGSRISGARPSRTRCPAGSLSHSRHQLPFGGRGDEPGRARRRGTAWAGSSLFDVGNPRAALRNALIVAITRGDDDDDAQHHEDDRQPALDHGVADHGLHGRHGLGRAEGGLAVGEGLGNAALLAK